jgi:hypothetical protein
MKMIMISLIRSAEIIFRKNFIQHRRAKIPPTNNFLLTAPPTNNFL